MTIFCDIYFDLRDGLALFDTGEIAEAAWERKFGFLTHWGRHVTGAVCAIHEHISNEWPEDA